MRFLKYLPLAFAALAIAAPASSKSNKVTADTIIADIGTIQAKTVALRQTVEPFQGGLAGLLTALKINNAGNEVSKAIKQAIKDANAAAPFTDQEAINIGIAVNNLNPDVISTLDAFKSKRAAFDNPFPLSGIVLSTLKDQKKITQQLSDALTAKVPEAFRQIAGQLSQPVLAKFDEVIAVYSKK